jgi:23S rRNA (pseudouridine1915-N3)-methyltransferase
MRVHLIAVGKRMPAWVKESFTDYNKRLPDELHLNLIETTPATRSKHNPASKNIAEEDKKIRAAIPKRSMIIALDEKGKQFDSPSLSKKLASWFRQGRDITFVIGGADGLADDFKKSADMLWSLSSLTLPHALVRVIVVEQIYRAWTILNNHPYHRK